MVKRKRGEEPTASSSLQVESKKKATRGKVDPAQLRRALTANLIGTPEQGRKYSVRKAAAKYKDVNHAAVGKNALRIKKEHAANPQKSLESLINDYSEKARRLFSVFHTR